jgi:aspartate carbamoyltransferase catalytic subunit
MFFISPESLGMPPNQLEELDELGTSYQVSEKLSSFLKDLDILYVTRIQKERFPEAMDYNRVKDIYKIDRSILNSSKPELRIMHPLPRVGEIDPELDNSEQAIYFDQAKNGVVVRKALLSLLLGAV